MNLRGDERGAVYPYLIFWIGIVFFAFVWIVFNEVILHVNDLVAVGSDSGGTWGVLLTLYRLTPVVILLGLFVWAVVQGHREDRW